MFKHRLIIYVSSYFLYFSSEFESESLVGNIGKKLQKPLQIASATGLSVLLVAAVVLIEKRRRTSAATPSSQEPSPSITPSGDSKLKQNDFGMGSPVHSPGSAGENYYVSQLIYPRHQHTNKTNETSIIQRIAWKEEVRLVIK